MANTDPRLEGTLQIIWVAGPGSAEHGLRSAAERNIADMLEMDHQPGWFEIGCAAADTPVAVSMPARTASSAVIGLVAVARAGRGYATAVVARAFAGPAASHLTCQAPEAGHQQHAAGQQQNGEGERELLALALLLVPLRPARPAGHARRRHPGTMRHRLPPPHSRYCDQEVRPTAMMHDRTRSPGCR